jgi:tetratricopeptide (TPR) repeat protein
MALLIACLVASAANIRAQQPADPCATGAPQARVNACTAMLARPTLERGARVVAFANRATAHDQLDQFELALADFQAALGLDAHSALALRARAAALHRHGRSADALKDLALAVQQHPDDLAALRLRGAVYADTGQFARAVEDFSKVLDREPDLTVRQARGVALAAQGDHARAIGDFTRVLDRNPLARVARAARALSYFRTRQYEPAIADWTRLLEADPAQPAVVYCRAAAKVLLGDDTARAELEQVRQQRPDVAAAEATACPVAPATR